MHGYYCQKWALVEFYRLIVEESEVATVHFKSSFSSDLQTVSSVPAMALKDISINKTRKGAKEPTKSTLIMHSVQTVR